MTPANRSTALEEDKLPGTAEAAPVVRNGHDPVAGIMVAAGASMLLWAALAQIARWVTRSF